MFQMVAIFDIWDGIVNYIVHAASVNKGSAVDSYPL